MVKTLSIAAIRPNGDVLSKQSGIVARADATDEVAVLKSEVGHMVVTSVDGFVTPEAKIGDYRIFDKQQLIQYPGFKLFYRWDQPLMPPSDVLKMDPPTLMVMYQ